MLLITGAHGQLGQCLQALAADYPAYSFLHTDAQDLDITDRKSVMSFFDTHRPMWCLNCAAYTAVDKAESEEALATRINAVGPKNLAAACARYGTALIQVSTDYVYHNRQNVPFKEGDPTSPKGVYARTKLAGDRAALRGNPLTMVLRTSWVYAPVGHNFVKTMLRLGQERPSLNVVFDQIGTPTYAPDLAAAMLQIIDMVERGEVDKAAIAGVWHYSNEGVTSWYDFAQAIFELRGIDCRVNPIESSQYPTPAARPPFSVLNKAKIKAAFGLEIPHWRTSLITCLEQL
jgi:dTDP-4-dehydrorhamnose reductase